LQALSQQTVMRLVVLARSFEMMAARPGRVSLRVPPRSNCGRSMPRRRQIT